MRIFAFFGLLPLFRSLPLFGLLFFFTACKTNPNKAEILDTKVDKADIVNSDEQVGVNKDGDMIYQKKMILAEELRRLENDVYDAEDRVYGTRKYGTLGLFGQYSSCLRKLPSEQRAALPKLEKLDRWSDKDESAKMGIEASKDKLALVSEEKLKDRVAKLQEYRRVLQEREDQYTENIKTCETTGR
ncbi:MAG: hypothetical protein C5B49_10865 [Bdellovibrio sp.]|nr:MAG: hypothetical protein C5B49_10865 [Bdellovibrio sp.]